MGHLLAIDVGNTNTVLAVFDGQTLLGQWRLATRDDRTVDEYGLWLRLAWDHMGLSWQKLDAAIIGSVVPRTNFTLRQMCEKFGGFTPQVIGDPGLDVGMMVRLPRPDEVGADRLVNAAAAWDRYGESLIIVDFGTATTFDLVDNDGAYAGGVIAPGINLSLEALHQAAARLPKVEVVRPASVLGHDTVSAMQSGIYYGYVGLIEGIVTRLRNENPGVARVLATGGLAPLFARATEAIDETVSDLTIEGLRIIYERNR